MLTFHIDGHPTPIQCEATIPATVQALVGVSIQLKNGITAPLTEELLNSRLRYECYRVVEGKLQWSPGTDKVPVYIRDLGKIGYLVPGATPCDA